MKRLALLLMLVLLLPAVSWGLATTMEFGVRGGTDDTNLDEHYAATEIYFLKELPWQKEFSRGFRVYTRLDLGATYLEGDSARGGWLAAGGDVVLSFVDGAFELEAGWRPAYLSRHVYGVDDLGGAVQFVSHAGAAFSFGRAVVNYRFQHISNGGFYDHNPGLDMHMVGVGMRF